MHVRPSERRRALRAPPPSVRSGLGCLWCLAGASTRANRAQDQRLDEEGGTKREGHPTQYPISIVPWRPVPHLHVICYCSVKGFSAGTKCMSLEAYQLDICWRREGKH